jgi:hypothetical protein
MIKKTLLGVTLLAATGVASAQDTATAPVALPGDTGGIYQKGTLGFSLPITLLSNITSIVGGVAEPVPTVDVVYFLSPKAAVDLIVGINVHHYEMVTNAIPPATETTTVFGFALGLGYRLYTHKGKLHSYLEPSGVLDWADTSNSAAFGLRLGAAFGAERELADWMSLSGSIGAGLDLQNKFKDIQLTPTANLAANFYWK